MLCYEIKKVWAKTSSKIAILLLFLLVGITCWFAADVSYVNGRGEKETGYQAVRKLKEEEKKWAGILDEEKLRRVIEENKRINGTPEAKSEDITEKEIAYGWRQGMEEIRKLLNCSFAEGFRSYDYYRADNLTGEEADGFYENRVNLLKNWLADEGKDQFSDAEKSCLIYQYEVLETPFYYDYRKGWTQLFQYAPTVIMIAALILGFLVSGVFSCEFSWKSDAVFFSAAYGRSKGAAAKVKAGLCIVTILYWVTVLLYSGIVLLYFGTDGWMCPVQADFTGWKCFYNITVWQEYLLTMVGGYVGCLFISSLAMLISARTNSAVLAAITPFVLIFVPSFLSNINSSAISKILGLLPDRLLQISTALGYFDLYAFGNKVFGAVPILFLLYGMLAALLLSVIYQVYKKKQLP